MGGTCRAELVRWGLENLRQTSKNVEQTVRYTELSSTRFRDFWKD